ncbi:MAG: alpha/beta fold hydrolase [Gammaproteobacteria bacterium]
MIQDFDISGLVDLAAEHYRVIVFDRPGYGYSARPRGGKPWDPKAQADLLHSALQRLHVERPIVVGHSWGTLVAVSMALDYPPLRAKPGVALLLLLPHGPLRRTHDVSARHPRTRGYHALYDFTLARAHYAVWCPQDNVRAVRSAAKIRAFSCLDGTETEATAGKCRGEWTHDPGRLCTSPSLR